MRNNRHVCWGAGLLGLLENDISNSDGAQAKLARSPRSRFRRGTRGVREFLRGILNGSRIASGRAVIRYVNTTSTYSHVEGSTYLNTQRGPCSREGFLHGNRVITVLLQPVVPVDHGARSRNEKTASLCYVDPFPRYRAIDGETRDLWLGSAWGWQLVVYIRNLTVGCTFEQVRV